MSADGTLGGALEQARLRFGNRRHIIDRAGDRTFADLDRRASEMATGLRGLPAGARVAVEIANSFGHLAAMFAVWRVGAVLVPLNPRLSAAERDAICDHSGAATHVALTDAADPVITRRSEGPPEAGAGLAAIAFTSGTTGAPKGVEITHENMLWSAAAVIRTRRDRADAVAAMVSPICHLPVFVSHYLARLLSGGTVVVGRFDPGELLDLAARHGISDLPLVPAMVGPLLEKEAPSQGLRLRKVSVGSAVTPMDVKLALAARFPNAEILEAYGQTESTNGLTMTVGREALERPGTVGRPHAQIAMAIVDPDGRVLEPGRSGEIVCQGPCVMRGYFGDGVATAAALRGGWLHTGDLGRLDEDGYLFVTGRLKEIIISGGENVSPEEVEQSLLRHPAVAEAAVFGLPDDRWGERIVAAVVVRSAVDPTVLSEHVGTELARFKRPREIFVVEELPKSAAGKVRRQALRERFLDPVGKGNEG